MTVLAVKPVVDKHEVTCVLIVTESTPEGKITCMARIDYDVFKDKEQINPDAINFFEVLLDIVESDTLKNSKVTTVPSDT